MVDNDGVIEGSPPSEADGPGDTEGLMVDALTEVRASEDSPTSDSPDEQGVTEPGSDEEPVAKADAEEEAEVEAETEDDSPEETIPKASFLKRVNGLQAARRKTEKENLDLHMKLSEYAEAFKILQNRIIQAETKLQDYEEYDPREERVLQLEREKQAQEIRTKLEREHHQRAQEVERQSYVEHRADEIIEEAHVLAKKYPTLTAEEIVYKYRTSEMEIGDLAKEMHSQRYSYLREAMAKDYGKGRPKAPKAIKSQGSMPPLNGASEDDMVAYLESRGD